MPLRGHFLGRGLADAHSGGDQGPYQVHVPLGHHGLPEGVGTFLQEIQSLPGQGGQV